MNKTCECCGTEFVDRSRGQHGRWCSKGCGKRAYYQANRSVELERERVRYETNREAILDRKRVYREANRESIQNKDRAYHEANREAKSERNKVWRAANPDKAAQACRTWRLANPDKVREIDARKRARKHDAFVESVDSDVIYKRDGYKCQLCGKKVKMDKKWPHPLSPSIDHILPLSRGGTHEPRNVQLAHLRCNLSKGNTGVDQLRLVGV